MDRALPLAPVLPARSRPAVRLRGYLGMAGLHVALGLAMQAEPLVATLHALATLAYGVRLALAPRRFHRAIYVAAYITGAEIMWRMTKAHIFWEFGKYAVVLLVGLILLRTGMRRGQWRLAGLYFVLLLPSCLLTLRDFGIGAEAKDALSFNMSGPLALAACVALFSGTSAGTLQIDRLFRSLLWPILGVLALAGTSTLEADTITFSSQSNFVTSGGFGPNQVSAVLGLGGLASLLLALHARNRSARWFFAATGGVLIVQTLLTFSRGGLFNLSVSLGLLSVHYIQRRRTRQIFLGLLIVLLVVVSQVVVPRLNEWTGGALAERYTSLDTTGREEIATADLELWKEHPLFGVGPGRAAYSRRTIFHRLIAPHTEFTRLVAEHGLLGALALLTLLVLTARAYVSNPDLISKAWVAALAGWSFAEMAHSGMRIVAISFLIGLATLRWPPLPRRSPAAPRPPPWSPSPGTGRAS